MGLHRNSNGCFHFRNRNTAVSEEKRQLRDRFRSDKTVINLLQNRYGSETGTTGCYLAYAHLAHDKTKLPPHGGSRSTPEPQRRGMRQKHIRR
jgi:hypothetical protein